MKRLLPVSLLALMATSAVAEDPSGGESSSDPKHLWMKQLTRVPPGPYAQMRSVRLSYNVSWKNTVNAGKATIEVRPIQADEDLYVGSATGKSTGLARALWPYDFSAESRIEQDSLRPVVFSLSEKERNKQASYQLRFTDDELVMDTTEKDDRKPEDGLRSKTATFEHDFVQDCLSAIFYMRSMPLSQGDKVSMIVTPFNKPYLATSTVLGREERRVRGEKYNTIKMDLEFSKIQDDLSVQKTSKVKDVKIWLSDDAYRLPLDLQAYIAVGYISARLTDREWIK